LDDKFNLPLWYATQLASNKNIDFEHLPMTYWLDFHMGDVYAHRLMWRLTDGACRFPEASVNVAHEECFWAYEHELGVYVIADYSENMVTNISKDLGERANSGSDNSLTKYCQIVVNNI
jgi:hypothetical protein